MSDTELFEAFVASASPRLIRIARLVLRINRDAEDIVQEALIRVTGNGMTFVTGMPRTRMRTGLWFASRAVTCADHG
jgi:DNA-directed RNA polymerase specialized sigma24 family protein